VEGVGQEAQFGNAGIVCQAMAVFCQWLAASADPSYLLSPQAFQMKASEEWAHEEVSVGAVAASAIPYDIGLGLCVPLVGQVWTSP
jgi:hypothetical protein